MDKMIALQIDLARQKETEEYLKSLVDFAKKSGYNTIFLYLETCVRTEDTPFFSVDETYSLSEMKRIVDYIEGCGMTAVPAFENFYHIEKLLFYDEFAYLAEFSDERTQGRGWAPPVYPRGAVGCTSNPRLNEFFDKYISDVAALFHGKYIHMGLDEIFEFGECERCRKRIENGETKKDIFLKQVLHNYALCKKLGKTMMMWDDFFEYYDILDSLPKDVVLGHWNYNFVGSETRGHWTGRVRRDWLSLYDELGFEYFFCTWSRSTSTTYNVDSLTKYALKHKPMGALNTEWERSDGFYLGTYPLVAYSAKLWNGEIHSEEDGLKVYVDVIGDREAAKAAFYAVTVNAAAYNVSVGKIAEDDALIKLAARRQLGETVEKLRKRLDKTSGLGADVLTDIYCETYDRYLIAELHALGEDVFDGYETGRTDFSSVYKKLDEIERGADEINSLTDALWKKYRGDLKSVKGQYEATKLYRKNLAPTVKKQIEENIGCGVLYLDMVTIDGFASPKIRVRIKYVGDKEESLVYDGGIKPGVNSFDVSGCHTFRLAIKNQPVEYVSLSAYGEGSLCSSTLRTLTLGKKREPRGVEKLGGRVINETALLTPDVSFCEYGYPDALAHLDDVTLSRKESGVKIYF